MHEKALTELQLIGQGRTADVYAWKDRRVLKLFHDDFPQEWISYEAKVSQLAFQAGLAAPATDGTLTVDGRIGIIYERVDGPSMLRLISSKPWLIFRLARQFAEVQAAMHRTVGKGFPSQRERLERNIGSVSQLTPASKDRLIRLLHELPDGEVVCHGDYHPDNLIFSPRGPIVIDWMTAVRGNPVADIARTTLLFNTPYFLLEMSGLQKHFLNLGRALLHVCYWREYRKLIPVSREQIEAWIPVVAAARLIEHVPGEEDWLLDIIKRALESAR